MFTQDEDLLSEAAIRQREGQQFAGVIYARQHVVSIGQCISDLELIAHAGRREEFANRVRYLPLR